MRGTPLKLLFSYQIRARLTQDYYKAVVQSISSYCTKVLAKAPSNMPVKFTVTHNSWLYQINFSDYHADWAGRPSRTEDTLMRREIPFGDRNFGDFGVGSSG